MSDYRRMGRKFRKKYYRFLRYTNGPRLQKDREFFLRSRRIRRGHVDA